MSDRSRGETALVRSASGSPVRRHSAPCSAKAWRWSRRPPPISTAPGRTGGQALERPPALAYATESMRLTTRLMQLASWLLLHRAVKEGEMTLAQANKEKTKVKLSAAEPGDPEAIDRCCREQLQGLIARSTKLQATGPPARRHHPRTGSPNAPRSAIRSSVSWLLKAAFEQDKPGCDRALRSRPHKSKARRREHAGVVAFAGMPTVRRHQV